jgi:hypothetical protein
MELHCSNGIYELYYSITCWPNVAYRPERGAGLEEAFQINVDESSAQEIQTVGDAAALIDKLIAEKDA